MKESLAQLKRLVIGTSDKFTSFIPVEVYHDLESCRLLLGCVNDGRTVAVLLLPNTFPRCSHT